MIRNGYKVIMLCLLKLIICYLITFVCLISLAYAGIDIYSGSISTYLTGNWETSNAKYAREHNLTYKMVRPNQGMSEANANNTEVLSIIQKWRDKVVTDLNNSNFKIQGWNELLDSKYNTINIAPNFFDYVKNYEEKTSKSLDQLNIVLWIPIEKKVLFEGINFRGEQSFIGSSQGMIDAINELSNYYYEKPIIHLKNEDKIKNKKLDERLNKNFSLATQLLAIYEISTWSLKNNFPMVLDY